MQTQIIQDSPPADTLVHPPASLLVTVTNPKTGQPNYAFPLQTNAWLKMQTAVTLALKFPFSKDQFSSMYGAFSDEGTVEQAVQILADINKTANEYGDPTTLISQLAAFQNAHIPPASIYGNAVWLAAQTQLAAQEIASLLQIGLEEIGSEPDPQTRITYLTELLTGTGGVSSQANTLMNQISDFEGKTTTFYTTLTQELKGPSNSLQWYLNQQGNILIDARNKVTELNNRIDDLHDDLEKLNKEYIAFTVSASMAPVFLLIPIAGVVLAVADAATFGALATKVKNQIAAVKEELEEKEEDLIKKTALVSQLEGFTRATTEVETDGTEFLTAISALISGWAEFEGQISKRLDSLTAEDVEVWDRFQDKFHFRGALAGWNLIAATAEKFFQTGFVQFSPG